MLYFIYIFFFQLEVCEFILIYVYLYFSYCVFAVPLPPTNVTYNKSSLTSYSFDAVWSPPKTISEFDRYQVALGIRNSVRQTISRSEKRIAHFNENLEPGRTYEVIVKTVSGNVASWPAAVNITTSVFFLNMLLILIFVSCLS